MAQIAQGRTVLVIAHRLSALRMADRIITIERCRLIEDGAHDELIKTGGRYAPSIDSRQGCMTPTKNMVAFPKQREERRKNELAFLPAALEIVEIPPSPIGRAIAFTIIAVFGIALAWACIGTGDIVAVAPGKIIPTGRTKTIQPFETGVVRAIHVGDGQSVRAGDVLIELDPTMSGAELGHLKSDLVAAQLDSARLQAALAGKDDPLAAFKPPDDAPPDLIQMHRRSARPLNRTPNLPP